MNSKQFGKLLVLVLVIGGIGLLINTNRQKAWKSASGGGGAKVLGDFDVNKVAGLRIQTKDGEINVIRKGAEWTVKERGGYPAKFSTVADFVRKVAELKVVQSEQIGESQFARMEVNTPKAEKGPGVLVEMIGEDGKPLKSLLLGKQQMKKSEQNSPMGGGSDFAVGRWVLNTGDKQNILLVSETFSDATTDGKDWLDKGFVEVQKLKSIEVMAPEKTNSWKVIRDKEDGTWQLQDVKKTENIDTNKVSSVGNPLGSPSFQDVVTGKKPEELGLDKPTGVKLATFDGFNYDVKIGNKTEGDDYYFQVTVAGNPVKTRTPVKDEKPEDKERLDKEFSENLKKLEEKLSRQTGFNKWTYLVSKWTVDSFLKKRSDFMAEKKEEEKKDSPIPLVPTPLLKPTLTEKPTPKKTETKPVPGVRKEPLEPAKITPKSLEPVKNPNSKPAAKKAPVKPAAKKIVPAKKTTAKPPVAEKKVAKPTEKAVVKESPKKE